MIKIMVMDTQGDIHIDLNLDDTKEILQSTKTLLWIDLFGEPTEEFSTLLRNVFRFHPLAVDDALTEKHIPKVDDWDEYLYLVLHGVSIDRDNQYAVQTPELDIFVGKDYLITYHKKECVFLDTLWGHCQKNSRYLRNGTMRLLYHLSDEMTNNFIQINDQMSDIVEKVEDQVFDNPSHDILSQLFSLKRSLQRLRRTVFHQREVFNKLSRGGISLVNDSELIYFRDTYDHMARLQENVDGLRELTSGALDTYLSVINNRMNEVMKTLTVITTIFMPLSFITGFFGMNFFQASFLSDVWTGETIFAMVLALIIFIPASMYIWMRKRAWM